MAQFWTRTRRYLAAVWIGTAVAEAGVLEMARRTNNSWILLLGLALLVVPLAATEMTLRWLGRAPRKRWKRHDVEAGLPITPVVAYPPEPSADTPRPAV